MSEKSICFDFSQLIEQVPFFEVLYIQMTITHYPFLKIIEGSYQYISILNNIREEDYPKYRAANIQNKVIKKVVVIPNAFLHKLFLIFSILNDFISTFSSTK
jgi:hypothetical protein